MGEMIYDSTYPILYDSQLIIRCLHIVFNHTGHNYILKYPNIRKIMDLDIRFQRIVKKYQSIPRIGDNEIILR